VQAICRKRVLKSVRFVGINGTFLLGMRSVTNGARLKDGKKKRATSTTQIDGYSRAGVEGSYACIVENQKVLREGGRVRIRDKILGKDGNVST